jgi:hypothetical protein
MPWSNQFDYSDSEIRYSSCASALISLQIVLNYSNLPMQSISKHYDTIRLDLPGLIDGNDVQSFQTFSPGGFSVFDRNFIFL